MEKVSPRVSVIMPAYNREKTIEAALMSAMQQDYLDMEYIVVNDGSQDTTPKIVEGLQQQDPRIKLVNNDRNLGISRSRNVGMQHATGEIFAVLDSDDMWIRKDKISKQVSFLEGHPAVGILGTNSIVKKNGLYMPTEENLTDEDIRKNTLRGTQFLHSSMVYPRNVYEKVGGYDENIKYAEDREYQMRAGRYFEFANLPEYTVLYNAHPENVSHKHRERQGMESARLSLKYVKDYPNAFPCITKKLLSAGYKMTSQSLDMVPGFKARLKTIIKGKGLSEEELRAMGIQDVYIN